MAKQIPVDSFDEPKNCDHFPPVCVQLPIYNEPYLSHGLLESIQSLDWPQTRMEIQVLDDSTDATTAIIKREISKISKNSGIKITHLKRNNRDGYKAGALNHGLKQTNAEYIAIFDCDFRPHSDFLQKTIPHFARQKVAAVQVPWAYRNGAQNTLTRLQSMLLNTHFYIEHRGRSERGLLFNFNGTGGVWRKKVLDKLGGWSSHSVTEDLYLSYKTWLAGYQIKFLPEENCSSELPISWGEFLIQQRRWALGNGQVIRLLLGKLLKAPHLSMIQKTDAILHGLGYGFSFFLGVLFLLSPIWMTSVSQWIQATDALSPGRILSLSLWLILITTFIKLFSHPLAHKRNDLREIQRWGYAFVLFSLAPYFALFITPSFIRGCLHRPGNSKYLVFHRTPKGFLNSHLMSWDKMIYLLLWGFTAFLIPFSFAQGLYLATLFTIFQLYFFTDIMKPGSLRGCDNPLVAAVEKA